MFYISFINIARRTLADRGGGFSVLTHSNINKALGQSACRIHKAMLISSLHICMVNIKLKYNFVETQRKFTITKPSILFVP